MWSMCIILKNWMNFFRILKDTPPWFYLGLPMRCHHQHMLHALSHLHLPLPCPFCHADLPHNSHLLFTGACQGCIALVHLHQFPPYKDSLWKRTKIWVWGWKFLNVYKIPFYSSLFYLNPPRGYFSLAGADVPTTKCSLKILKDRRSGLLLYCVTL